MKSNKTKILLKGKKMENSWHNIMRYGLSKGFFLLVIYCWPCSLPLRIVCFPSETFLEEMKFSFVSVVSVEDWFWVRDGATCAFLLSASSRAPSDASLVHAFSVSMSSHVGQSCWFKGPCFLGVLHPLWLLHCFCLLFCGLHWALREGTWWGQSV